MRQTDSANDGEVVVTVAATHPFAPVFEIGRDAPAQGADWAGLPKTTVHAQRDETLRDILRTAGRKLEVSVSREVVQMDAGFRAEQGIPARSSDIGDWLVFVGFRREDDDDIAAEYDGIKIRNWNSRINQRVVVVRDEKGRATWRRPPFDATIGELLDAREAGLIDGDPRQVYLVPSIPQGAFGLGGEWQHFVDNLKILWEVTDAIARVGGAASAVYWLKTLTERRSKGAEEAIEAHGAEWTERGAAPADVVNLLAARPRTKEEIAALLGCTDNEAEAVLWTLGCTYDKATNLWNPRGDPVAELIADDISLGFTDILASRELDEKFKTMIDSRLRRFLETGEMPSLEDDRRELRDNYFSAFDAKGDGPDANHTSSLLGGVNAQLKHAQRRLGRWIRSRVDTG